VESREFRFYIGRICKIAQCKDMAKPPDFFDEITMCMVNYIDLVPHAMDQIYNYLATVSINKNMLQEIMTFLMDENKAIYGWQNYLIWKLLVLHEFDHDRLKLHAQIVLNHSEDKTNIAGAALYLGKFGDYSHRELVVSYFKKCDCFFLQRHLLIAIQEMPYSKIKHEIGSHILPESKNIYKNLTRLKTPCYIEPPKKIAYTDLIREVSFYA
jgi:hypothetical protein